MTGYELTEKVTPAGFQIIRITDGAYEGIEYSYGKVAFEDRDDKMAVTFDYDIQSDHSLIPPIAEHFGQVIGEILTDILMKQTETSEVVYGGGK